MGTVVEEQLQTIQDNVNDAYTALESKGATLPAVGSRGSENLASTVNSITSPTYPCFRVSVDGSGTVSKSSGTIAHAFDNWVTVSAGTFTEEPFYGIIVDSDVVFQNLTTVETEGMMYALKNLNISSDGTKKALSFPILTTVGVRGLKECCAYAKWLDSVSFDNLKTITNESALESFAAGGMYNRGTITTVSFPKLKTVSAKRAMNRAFAYNPVTTVNLPELETVSGDYAFQGFTAECKTTPTVECPKLKTINGTQAFSDMKLTLSEYPFLESISGSSATAYSFGGLTSVSFPALTSITNGGCNSAFSGAGLQSQSVSWPLLATLGDYALGAAFTGCPLETISFPSLSSVSKTAFKDGNGTMAFHNCTNLTEIHFPAAIQATIERLNGYSSKFGASNATIYFDL